MKRTVIPSWVYAGGLLLTLISGCVNATGFLSLQRTALSHMSGMVTTLGLSAASGNTALLQQAFTVLVSFFVGGMLSGYILKESTLRLGRRYGAVLALESLLLVLAALYLARGWQSGIYLAAMACGLQNAMASSFSGAVMRTTHCTGMVTDLGIACGQALRGRTVEWMRFRLYAVLISGFLGGAFLGSLGFTHLGTNVLLFPAVLSFVTGLAYLIFKHHERLSLSAGEPVGVSGFVSSLTPSRLLRNGAPAPEPSTSFSMSDDFLSPRVINRALDRLSVLAGEDGLIMEVALCHGRVFAVAYRHHADLAQARRQVEPLQRASALLQRVSSELRLPSDWVQQDLRYHLALQAARGPALKDSPRTHLILSIAAPALILAVKLHAYNAAPQAASADTRELAFLLEKTGMDSLESVEKAYACFYPAGRLEPGLRGMLAGLLPAAA